MRHFKNMSKFPCVNDRACRSCNLYEFWKFKIKFRFRLLTVEEAIGEVFVGTIMRKQEIHRESKGQRKETLKVIYDSILHIASED